MQTHDKSSGQWSLQDAKNKFSEVVEAARRGMPQLVTRRGRPAVVVLAVEEFENMRLSEKLAVPRFSDFLLTMPTCGQTDGEVQTRRSDLTLRDVEL